MSEGQKMFPIVPTREPREAPHPTKIPWEIAEKAYSVYRAHCGGGQTLERLGERGGFHASEMDELYPAWREETDLLPQLRARIRELEGELVDSELNRNLNRDARNAAMGRADKAEAELAEARAEVDAIRTITAVTMGVGSGGGKLFVHGDYDSIKACQDICLSAEVARLREALQELASSPCCETEGCCVDDPKCDSMTARAALAAQPEQDKKIAPFVHVRDACKHQWDGPEVGIGKGSSVTCSKCGIAQYRIPLERRTEQEGEA